MNDIVDPATRTAESALKTAESVANYGALVVITAFAIILCTIMIIYFFVSHRRMTKNMEEQNRQNNIALSITLKRLEDYLQPVSENARLSTLTALHAIAEQNFRLSVENVLQIIERIQSENHIEDENRTKRKLRMFITNMHNDRKLYFSNFTFSGHAVDYYTDPKWIETMVEAAFPEIYDKNKSRARTNIKQAYDTIFIEFKRNLISK
jgi:hypothetical protein